MTDMATLDKFLKRIVADHDEGRPDFAKWGNAYEHIPDTDITAEAIIARVAELVAERDAVPVLRALPENDPE